MSDYPDGYQVRDLAKVQTAPEDDTVVVIGVASSGEIILRMMQYHVQRAVRSHHRVRLTQSTMSQKAALQTDITTKGNPR